MPYVVTLESQLLVGSSLQLGKPSIRNQSADDINGITTGFIHASMSYGYLFKCGEFMVP